MIKNSEKTKVAMSNIGKLMNRLISRDFTIERLAEMEAEDFDMYKALAKSYQEFSDISVAYAEQLDEQSEMLSSLQEDMKKILEK